MTPKQAIALIGGLSNPSKMPGYGYSLPARRCNIGSKLRKIKGSTCSVCYAFRGNYLFPRALAALERRYASLSDPLWPVAMVTAIRHYEKSGYFRWHDSGDIKDIAHLHNIVQIAHALPDIKFWLPTREYSIVSTYFKTHKVPRNLCIRLSAFMMDAPAPATIARSIGVQTSRVASTKYTCPASKQNNSCGECRKCWDKRVSNVTYKKH